MEMDFGISMGGGEGMAGPGSWSRGSEGGEGQGVMRWKAGVKGGRAVGHGTCWACGFHRNCSGKPVEGVMCDPTFPFKRSLGCFVEKALGGWVGGDQLASEAHVPRRRPPMVWVVVTLEKPNRT